MMAIRTFRDELGLELHVTELDIGIAKETETEPGHTEEYQGEYYQKFMEALLKEKKDGANITSVTFWGVSDNLSWRPEENCLLLNEDLSKKPAFQGVVDAIGGTGAVIDKIKAIGDVTTGEECKARIEEARAAYDALTDAQKELVTNYETLMAAETKYEEVIKNQTDPEKKSIGKAKIAEIKTQIYTGKEIKPAVTVTYEGKTLSEGTDYTVFYGNNIKIGTATVSIVGKGHYNGNTTAAFEISVQKDRSYTVGNYKYKITNANTSGKGTVMVTGISTSKKKRTIKSIKLADTVNIGGKNFKITTIGNAAFRNCKKLTSVTIGKNAMKGIHARAKIKVPTKKLKAYKKLLRGTGQVK